MSAFDEAHSAVSVGIAERYLCQSPDMTWEDRCDELATAAIEAMQLFIQGEHEADTFMLERRASRLKRISA